MKSNDYYNIHKKIQVHSTKLNIVLIRRTPLPPTLTAYHTLPQGSVLYFFSLKWRQWMILQLVVAFWWKKQAFKRDSKIFKGVLTIPFRTTVLN